MPFALVTIGLLMIVTGAKGTHKCFGADVAEDFTGPGNFLYWLVAIGIVGSVGYSPAWREFSTVFLTLIIVAMVIANRGVFDQLQTALNTRLVNTCNATGGTTGERGRGTISIRSLSEAERNAFTATP